MKIQELRKKNASELHEILMNLLRKRFGLYMKKKHNGESRKNHTIKTLRKTIAQIKTLITEKTQDEKNENITRRHCK